MKIDSKHKKVFKAGSTTYFNSSIFFPPDVRDQVFRLYSFVRTADDYVDQIPQNTKGFKSFRLSYEKCLKSNKPSGNIIIDDFIDLKKEKEFPDEWVTAFLDSMEADLTKSSYNNLEETIKYIYGSAEVIGLFMSSIMGLDKKAEHSAKMLGRAMQYINFIRDIAEDNSLGRTYLPLKGSGLKNLDYNYVTRYKNEFVEFVRNQISLYRKWQSEAEEGYSYIPKRYRIAIKTAGDMYKWTADQIENNPLIVFDKKCKPEKSQIIFKALLNSIRIFFS